MSPAIRTVGALTCLALVVFATSQPGAAPTFSAWVVPTTSSPIQRSCFRCVPVFFVLPKHPSDGLENRNNDAPHEGGQLEEPAATPGGSPRDVVSLGREVISHTERRATKRAGDKGAFSVDLMPAQG
jgi:hypothetical protein